MTIYREIPVMGHIICGIILLILLTLAIYLLIAVSVMHLGGKRDQVAAACLTIFVFLLLQGIMDTYIDYSYFFEEWVGNLPCGVIILLLLSVMVVEAVLLRKMFLRKKQMLTPGTIKESLDALPDGVCFYEPDGRPILVNARMNQISGELFGTEILNAGQFIDSLGEINNKPGGGESGVLAETKDGRVWEFSKNILIINNAKVHELIACDITQQYHLSRELKERNEQLNRVNERLQQFSRDMVYFTAEKELLEAKIRVHDDVGRALLAFRSYMAQKQEGRDRKKLLIIWSYVISVMKKETAPAGEWDLLEETAQSLNIKLNFSGELPENVQYRTAILTAIHECLTNTAKHARGESLDVLVQWDNTSVMAQLTNTGRPPEGEILEGGGLRNLRNIVERSGGTMTIQSSPRFLLRIEFVRNGE